MKLSYLLLQSHSLIIATDNIANNASSIASWQNLISAIIGGILVVAGHYIIERKRISNENHQEIVNTVSKLSEIKYLLKNLFRELAMYKTHASYWWFCTIKEQGQESEKHRQEHLRSQKEAREIEKQIGKNIAKFLGQIIKFKVLSTKKIDVTQWIKKIDKIKFRKANEYSTSQGYDKVRKELVENDEEKLRTEYFNNLKPFENIIAKLKSKA